jgi:Ca2+-binding RTX toxin-like protein
MATINGTAGPDLLLGDDSDGLGVGGADLIRGAGGNDTIDGQGGINEIYGDDGDDLIRIVQVESVEVRSTIDGGLGNDTLDLSGSKQATIITELDSAAGIFAIKYFDGLFSYHTIVERGVGIESFVLGPQFSTLALPNWTTPLLVRSTSQGRISTGSGDDTIIGSAASESITLNGGSDSVTGGGGSDSFTIATLSGNADDIRITGSTDGSNSLILEAAAIAGRAVMIDLANGLGTLGATSLHFSGIGAVDFRGAGISTVVRGNADDNYISAGGGLSDFGIEVHGAGGDDVLTGGAGNDSLSGDAGNDELSGEGGDDLLQGGDGHDWIEGDIDTVVDSGSDTIMAGNGNDHIWGFARDGSETDLGDWLDAGDGSDYVNGNGGADTIFGGNGSDRLRGGADNDLIDGGNGSDEINGNKGNDTILGGEGNDILRGGQGNDLLTGGAGNDIMSGDLGNDTLVAGAGVDIMTGGQGTDRFDLSASDAAGIDPSGLLTTILDFLDGVDTLRLSFTPSNGGVLHATESFTTFAAARVAAQALLSGTAATAEVAALQVGADTYLFYNGSGAGDTITASFAISGVSAATIDSSDFE